MGSDEHRSGVAHPGGHRPGVLGLDLQVLGGVGVDHPQPVGQVGDQHAAGLGARQRRPDPLAVPGGRDPARQFGVHGVGEVGRGGHQHAGGQLVVLGLADEVGGDVDRVGGVVGEHGDLGRTGLGVDADQPAQFPLGGGHVDVARPGDQVDGDQVLPRGVLPPVGEQGDRLRAPDRPDLGDAEQLAGGQDGGVRQPAEVGLGRRAHHQRVHAGLLGGYDVHDHARRVDGVAPGDVEADPGHRDPPFGHRAAGHDLGGHVPPALGGVHPGGAGDALHQRGPHPGFEVPLGVGEGLGRDADAGRAHTVEALGEVERRRDPVPPDLLDERAHPMQHRVHVYLGARQHRAQLGGGRDAVPQVCSGEHRVPRTRRSVAALRVPRTGLRVGSRPSGQVQAPPAASRPERPPRVDGGTRPRTGLSGHSC